MKSLNIKKRFQVDLLKSALEINNKALNPLRKDGKSSNPSLRSPLAGSDPKLFNHHHHSKSGSIEFTDQVRLFNFLIV